GCLGVENPFSSVLHLVEARLGLPRRQRQFPGLAATGDARQIDAVIVVAATCAFGKARAVVTAGAFARVLAHKTEESFLIAAANAVYGDDEYGTASCLGTFDERLGYLPLGRSIKLKPD